MAGVDSGGGGVWVLVCVLGKIEEGIPWGKDGWEGGRVLGR